MKHFAASYLMAAFSALSVFADTATESSYTVSSTTSMITDSPTLELRQVAAGLANPEAGAAALTAVAGAGEVTQYNINSQVGPSSGVNVPVIYTQTFANVPDQWPSAKPGVIGMGKLKKRDVEAEPTLVEEARVAQRTGIAGRIRR